tara:strand:- start:3674 stop:4594 length:921 start_codon:yes stop_codon:yes gene_type:complete
MAQFSAEYGQSGDWFGHADYVEAKKQGASDRDIISFLDENPNLLRSWNVKGGGGLYDQVAKSAKSSADAYQEDIDTYKTQASTYKDQAAKATTQAETYRTAAGQFKDAADLFKGEIDSYKEKIADYDERIGGLRNEITGYTTQIGGLQNDLRGYQDRFSTLTGQYNTALSTAASNAKARDDYQRQFQEASALYEKEKAEADRYREMSIGEQLRAVRGGITAGGGRQTDQMAGSLASGRTGYSSEDRDIGDLAESLRAQGGLTDSVLSREGPVVQQLSGGSGRSSGGGQRQMRSSAGTGSYYASRFR